MVDVLDTDDPHDRSYDLGDVTPYRIFRRSDVDGDVAPFRSSIGSLDLFWTDRGGLLRLVAIGSRLSVERLVTELWGEVTPELSADGRVLLLTPTRVDPEMTAALLAASYRVLAAEDSVGLYGAAAAAAIGSLVDLLVGRIDDSDGGIGQILVDLRESAEDLATDSLSAFLGLPMDASPKFPDETRREIFAIAEELKSQLDDFGRSSVDTFITRSVEVEIDDALKAINRVIGLVAEPVAPIRGIGQPVVDVDPRFAEFGLGPGDAVTAPVEGSEEELVEVVLDVHDWVRERAVDMGRRWLDAVRVMVDPGSDDATIETALRALRLAHYRLNAVVVLGVSTDVLDRRSADDIERSLLEQLEKRRRVTSGDGREVTFEIEPPAMLPVMWCEEVDPTDVGGRDIGSEDDDPDRGRRWRVMMVPPALTDPFGATPEHPEYPTGLLPLAETSGYVARLALVGRPGRIRVSLDPDPSETRWEEGTARMSSLASLRRTVNHRIAAGDTEPDEVDTEADIVVTAAFWLALSHDPDLNYGDAEDRYRDLVGDDPRMTVMVEDLAAAMSDPKIENRRDQLRRLRNGAALEVDTCVTSSEPDAVTDELRGRVDEAVDVIRRIDRFIYGKRRRGLNRP